MSRFKVTVEVTRRELEVYYVDADSKEEAGEYVMDGNVEYPEGRSSLGIRCALWEEPEEVEESSTYFFTVATVCGIVSCKQRRRYHD